MLTFIARIVLAGLLLASWTPAPAQSAAPARSAAPS